MSDSLTWLSREQRAEVDFGDVMTRLRSHFEEREGRVAVDAMTEATLRFGACERGMRRSERLRALGLREAEAKELAELALANNERGLAALAGVRSLVDYLSDQEADAEGLSRWRESSPQLRADWREHVAELDLGSADARHLTRIMDECCDAVDERGAAGLGRHISRTLGELEEARRSEDRGTHAASFPFWKIAAAAIIVGIAFGTALFLVTRGAPWWNSYLIWLLACFAVLFVVLGC